MSNPILNEAIFSPQAQFLDGEPMTIQGTVNKVFLLFACLLAGCALSVYYLLSNPAIAIVLMLAGGFVTFILVLITYLSVKSAKYLAAPYALFEGFTLGALSAFFETIYHGIVIQAVLATFVVLFIMLGLYKARIIQYTKKFRTILITSILSILALYIIQIITMFFPKNIFLLIWGNGMLGIALRLFMIIIAAMSLIQDFAFIESYSKKKLSKDYEWLGAMGLMITLIWLYTEILKLLARLNSKKYRFLNNK